MQETSCENACFTFFCCNSTEFHESYIYEEILYENTRVLAFLRNYGEILCDNDRFILFFYTSLFYGILLNLHL